MIFYELKIEAGEDAISISAESSAIFFAEIVLDTENNYAKKKSNAIQARMTIRGKIEPEITDSLLKISEWARDLNDDTTYRKVTLTIKADAAGKILRTYEIPMMFVIDYFETYDAPKEDDATIFELVLAQKENQLKDFNTY